MASASLLSCVRHYLASHYMFVDEEWLSECVAYLSSDTNYSETEIKNLAKEQWLLNDLKSICPGSLPANLKSQQKTLLNGRFVLQINSAMDIDLGKLGLSKDIAIITKLGRWIGDRSKMESILVLMHAAAQPFMSLTSSVHGTPAYQQYLKLQKVNMENVEATTRYEDKVSSHRMIKLQLTDGVQEISAIEYKPMRNLSSDITPGCKVLIKGPVDCRRGMLLLTEAAIELLGGEVEEMVISNSLAGQIANKLGVSISPESALNTTINQPRNTDIPTPHSDMPSAAPTSVPTLDHTRPVVHQPTFIDDDIDIDQLDALEAQLIDNPGKRSLPTTTSNPEKKLKTDTKTTVNQIDDYPDENDLFFDEDEDALRELEAQIHAQDLTPKPATNNDQIPLSSEPFVYIKQIKDMKEDDKFGKSFKIKGQVMSLLTKLSVDKNEWSLKCTIVDGTGTLDVDFTNDVLSKLVGFTPQEMNVMRKQMAKNSEIREKAVSALQKARDTLQVLYCIIEVTMLEFPKITNLTPFEGAHVDQLNRRLGNSGL